MRFIKAAWSWLVDQAIEHWATIVSVAGGGGMIYLASISDWLAPYGPVAWGGIGIASFLVLALAFFASSLARMRFALAHYTEAKSTTSSVNVLSPTHAHERIELVDFYHPYGKPTGNAQFQDCDLHGPAMVMMMRGSVTSSAFVSCQIVIMKGASTQVEGAITFLNCQFHHCAFFKVTFLIPREAYERMPVLHPLPIISEESIKPPVVGES